MRSLRRMATGAALLVGLALAGTSAHACDDRFTAACQPPVGAETPSEGVAALATPATSKARSARSARAERRKKARFALSRHLPRPRAERPSEAAAPAAPVPQENSTAARRFREFVNPQSFAVSTIEDLRRPRPHSSHFLAQATDPGTITSWTVNNELEPEPQPQTQTHVARIVAQDDGVGSDVGDGLLPPSRSDSAAIRYAAPADQAPAQMSLLRWFFVAWGGFLTIASALRMVVG